ncbi:hypothetical protein F2Q69_00027919 [Brassica cretica]|uniref:Uncharacterized protein n=1 Tax=Brassica cretica TaxID=69181 RepID=A0A8S9S6Y2_BRACR|nr:hypothetical protein F2Q69_00027919 [Brassica cretica]
MTHSFLERIGQPEIDLANDREESVPFNVHDATSIPEFSSSQMFSMLFRDSLGTTETERNALVFYMHGCDKKCCIVFDYVHDRLDMLLAFRRILDCRLPTWDDLL